MGSQQTQEPKIPELMMSEVYPDDRKLAEDDTASRLARLWERVLGIESVGLDENYFDLGGDSALSVHLLSQIEKIFNVKLPVSALFEAPTVAELAGFLREKTRHLNHP